MTDVTYAIIDEMENASVDSPNPGPTPTFSKAWLRPGR